MARQDVMDRLEKATRSAGLAPVNPEQRKHDTKMLRALHGEIAEDTQLARRRDQTGKEPEKARQRSPSLGR